jgi:hypothetical protein
MPKLETRNSKLEGNLKPETRNGLPRGCLPERGGRPPDAAVFEFRNSSFLRVSSFEFRVFMVIVLINGNGKIIGRSQDGKRPERVCAVHTTGVREA